MPIREYFCEYCAKVYERLEQSSTPPMDKCETCGDKVAKMFPRGVSAQFKGSGFFCNDYRKKPNNPPEN